MSFARLSPYLLRAILIGLLALCAACTKASRDTTPSSNVLDLGPTSKAPDKIDVAAVAPVNLNGQSLEQLLQARASVVQHQSALLVSPYTPTQFLFNRIDPSATWESMASTYYDGPTKMCGDGPSTDSTAILNPFVLVGARFFWQSTWEGSVPWATDKISPEQVRNPDFPLYIKAQELTWYPKEARAEVSYDLSGYLRKVAPWLKSPLGIRDTVFSLHPANARDFQFKYLYLSTTDSRGIIFPMTRDQATDIRDLFRNRKFTQTNTSCNGGGFPKPYTRGIKIGGIPAEVSVLLWREKPASISDKPDMTFVIRID